MYSLSFTHEIGRETWYMSRVDISTIQDTPRDIPKGMQLRLYHRHLHAHVYCGTIHKCQVIEIVKMPHY
jgi:hypothetical protein